MIYHEVSQNTDAWRILRAGKITASSMDRIVDSHGNLRKGQMPVTYRRELLTEWLLGQPIESGGSPWTDRGRGQEEDGALAYEWEREVTLERCGFFTTDDELVGCSPDRLCGEDGIVEIKTPSAVNHVGNLLSMTDDYKAQIQCQLFVTGRSWVDLVSFNPVMPLAIQRFERDDAFIANMRDALYGEGRFLDVLSEEKAKLERLGSRPATLPPAKCHHCGSTDDDVQTSDHLPTCSACRVKIEEIFGGKNGS